MRHLRRDYDAIQPFPVKRSHIVRIDGEVKDANSGSPDHLWTLGRHMDPLIPDDEPVFLLRGQDPVAAAVVMAYASGVESSGGDPEMVRQIRAWAGQMRDYAEAKQHGVPDVPQGQLRDGSL